MTRPRKRAESGFYHTVVKANADQSLFLSDSDRMNYLNLLTSITCDYPIEFHVWCLMSTHAHFIVNDPEFIFSTPIRDANAEFARYFNDVHNHTGVVFKHHYWSEPIENESYLLTAMNYIHHNPQAAGICPADEYRWSSFRAYAAGTEGQLTHTRLLLGMLNGSAGFLQFSQRTPTARPFPESKMTDDLDWDGIAYVAARVLGEATLRKLPYLPDDKRAAAGRRLLACCFTTSQIEKLTGLSHRAVLALTRRT